MKGSKAFEETIKAYLDKRAEEDDLFAKSYAKEGKNIEDCITYILDTVQKSGNNGFADEEIFSIAIHYYDEDTIEIGERVDSGRVMVNHHVELSAEEIEEARKQAMDKVVGEEYDKIKSAGAKSKSTTKKATAANTDQQTSLFE